VQIFFATVLDIEGDALGQIVRVQFADGIAHRGKSFGGGFDQKQPLATLFDFSLPAVNRFDLRDDVHAGGEPAFDQRMRDLARFFFASGGGEDDLFVGHFKAAPKSSPVGLYSVLKIQG
jgi:hypothetical protein